MRTIKRYFAVYQKFMMTSLSMSASFRINFILISLIDLAFFASSLATVSFIYDHVEKIGVWNRQEFMFFVSFMLMVDHLHMAFISGNFWRLSHNLKAGDLDFDLLKPIGSLFTVFFRFIRVASFLTTPVALYVLIYHSLDVGLSAWAWFALPFCIIAALTLLTSLEILLSMVMFWTVEAFGINFLRMQLQGLARWPDFVYQYFARKVFTIFIPILLVGSVPVSFLLEKSSPMIFTGFFAALFICWYLIRIVWRKGLRRYESASS